MKVFSFLLLKEYMLPHITQLSSVLCDDLDGCRGRWGRVLMGGIGRSGREVQEEGHIYMYIQLIHSVV